MQIYNKATDDSCYLDAQYSCRGVNDCFIESNSLSLRINTSRITLISVYYSMLSVTVLIDYLNGAYPNKHIGEVFRLLTVFLSVVLLSKYSKKRFTYCALIGGFLILNTVFAKQQGLSSFKYDLSIGMKSCLFFIICCTLMSLYDRGMIDTQYIKKIVTNNMFTAPLFFYFSLISGRGGMSYGFGGVGVGWKATFLSLNSINITMVILYAFAVWAMFESRKTLRYVVLCMYIGIPLLMLGTKTSLLMVVVVPIMFIVLNLNKQKTLYIVAVATVALIIGIAFLKRPLGLSIENILSRQKFLYSARSPITYIFSTRDERLGIVMKDFIESFWITDIFPGRGYYAFRSMIPDLMGRSEVLMPIEMDWADILTAYGIVGFFYTYYFSIKNILRSAKRYENKEVRPFFVGALIMVAYGTLAGHIFLEAITSTMLALLVAQCYILANQNSKMNGVYIFQD